MHAVTAFAFSAVAAHRSFLAYLERWLPQAVQLIPAAPPSISIALVGDRRMAALHEKFSGVPGPTDVLTFELEHDAHGRVTGGEIVLCVPFARREAKRRGTKPENELLLYALHGVLHLSGYDDRDPVTHARMHAEEDRILQEIKIGPVFQRGG